MRTSGIFQLNQMKFDTMPFEGKWFDTVGEPEKNFSCIIYGDSGNGKTTVIISFIKYLCSFGLRACYISHEEGISSTIQTAFKRAGMHEVSGDVILAADATFDETVEYFAKRGSPEIMVIDSIDYCNLTAEQYKLLRKKFPRKIIILISWSEGKKPKSTAGKAIEYMVDIKLFVKNFMIWPKSRFGGNKPYVIWEERARLLEQKYFIKQDEEREKAKRIAVKSAENELEEVGVDADE